MLQTNNSPSIEDTKHLRIPLKEIRSATREFDHLNFIARGGYGRVYKGESEKYGKIAVKRWDISYGQGEREFKTEISLLSKCEHENIVSLVGFCDENSEKILVYKYECNGSLDNYIKGSKDLTWIQRLQICIDVACGLNYLHSEVQSHQSFLHRDIKSSNILLDENWKPKISDFGLSKVVPVNMQSTFVISNPSGTPGYIDPDYYLNGYLTQKSDVYSFGVVLWEVLCGRLVKVACKNEPVVLPILVKKHYKRKTLDMIIPPELHKQINTASLLTFSNIAYQCLKNGEARPTMSQVVEQLRRALLDQEASCRILPKEVKKPEEGQSEEPVVRDDKNKGEAKDLLPPPPSQEVVLRAIMHCEECARGVKQRLRHFEGVEDIRIEKVELLSPVPKPPTEKFKKKYDKKDDKKDDNKKKFEEETYFKYYMIPQPYFTYEKLEESKKPEEFKKPEESKRREEMKPEESKKPEEFKKPEESKKREEFKKPEPDLKKPEESKPEPDLYLWRPIQEKEEGLLRVVLKVQLHCEDCAQKIKKSIWKKNRFIRAFHIINRSELVVIGIFDVEVLADYVHKKTGGKVVIKSIDKVIQVHEDYPQMATREMISSAWFTAWSWAWFSEPEGQPVEPVPRSDQEPVEPVRRSNQKQVDWLDRILVFLFYCILFYLSLFLFKLKSMY